MQTFIQRKGYLGLFFVIVVLGAILNLLWLKSAILGLIFAIFWLVYSSKIIGRCFLSNFDILTRYFYGLLLLLCLIVLAGSAWFYLAEFSTLAVVLIFGLISLLVFICSPKLAFNKQSVVVYKKLLDWKVCSYFALLITIFLILVLSSSGQAIFSPWQVVPKIIFILYFLATLFLMLIFFSKQNFETETKLLLISFHYLLSLSVAVIVYKIGYGFDPFVHRAVEVKLAELGYILPKPLYYTGQYILVVWLAKMFNFSIGWTDKLLVPILTALTLPAVIWSALCKRFNRQRLCPIVILAFLAVATPLFYYTLPQSLANLFFTILIFIILSWPKNTFPLLPVALALAALVTHPLSGLPAALLVSLYFLNRFELKKYIKYSFYAMACFIIPAFFVLAGFLSNNFSVKFSTASFSNLRFTVENFGTYLPFYSIYHLVYLFDYNWLILFILILIAGGFYLAKTKQKNILATSWRLGIILMANLILIGFLKFESVIDYEQAEFAKRLAAILVLSLSPIFATGLYFMFIQSLKLYKAKYIISLCLASLLTTVFYLSYPHNDAFTRARGYSVSADDIKAVQWIDRQATDEDYIVLANQSTAAAGLREFGFKKYYKINKTNNSKKQDLFYYSIPTSSPLYDIYLKMVYDKPSLELIEQARKITGAKTIYFVINNYWLDAKKRIKQAKKIADAEKNFNGRIWIFKFNTATISAKNE